MKDIVTEQVPVISYDPAYLADESIVMVSERQKITRIFEFKSEDEVSFPKYRILYTRDFKGLSYTAQIEELSALAKRVRITYNLDSEPPCIVDVTGNEALGDPLRKILPGI